MSRIGTTFKALRAEGKKAFIPYIMAGAPSLGRTRELIAMLEECGADIIELGVPYSDPVADGPVIQKAAERALQAGVRLRHIIGFVRELRQTSRIPIVLMTYYNPIFKYGEERFMREAALAGVDGIIVPDLPPHEADGLIALAKTYPVDTIFLVAPTSNDRRMRIVAKSARGFIYYVSITGVTGAALKMDDSISGSIGAVRRMSGKPVALGFGVSTAEEAARAAGMADGVIIGSAIVKRAEEPGFREYLMGLRAAIR